MSSSYVHAPNSAPSMLPTDNTPSRNDILLGRGHRINLWPGNIHFRTVIESKAKEYVDLGRHQDAKNRLAWSILQGFKERGRFLRQKTSLSNGVKVWKDETGRDEFLIVKIKQALRDAASKAEEEENTGGENASDCSDRKEASASSPKKRKIPRDTAKPNKLSRTKQHCDSDECFYPSRTESKLVAGVNDLPAMKTSFNANINLPLSNRSSSALAYPSYNALSADLASTSNEQERNALLDYYEESLLQKRARALRLQQPIDGALISLRDEPPYSSYSYRRPTNSIQNERKTPSSLDGTRLSRVQELEDLLQLQSASPVSASLSYPLLLRRLSVNDRLLRMLRRGDSLLQSLVAREESLAELIHADAASDEFRRRHCHRQHRTAEFDEP